MSATTLSQRGRGSLLSVLLAVGALFVTGPSVGEENPSDERASGEAKPLGEEGLARDAALAAEERGVDPETMEQYLKQEIEFAQILPNIELLAADRFAGGWLEARPAPHLVVALVGAGDNRMIEELIAPYGDQVEIRDGFAHSHAALLEAIGRVMDEGRRSGAVFSARVDVINNQIQVTLYPADASARTADFTRFAAALSASDVPVVLETSDEAAPTVDSRGGRLLDTCTAGFTVRNHADTLRGFLTAGHCDPPQPYYWWSDMQPRQTTVRGRLVTSSRDVAWYSIAPSVQGVVPWFHTSKAEYRVQSGTHAPPVGSTVCHWGAYSLDNGCATVISTNSTWTADKGAYFVEVSGRSFQSCNGDSGGPWYLGTLVVGTHTASSPKTSVRLNPHPGRPSVSCTAVSGAPAVKSAWYQSIGQGLDSLNVVLLTE